MAETYVVLEVPPPFADIVTGARRRWACWRVALPVEITVIGSGGVGVVGAEQPPASVRERISAVAAATRPVNVRFPRVERFPESGVFYAAVDDDGACAALQRRLVETGLRFEESAFPVFVPHCTLVSFDGEVSREVADEVLSTALPAEPLLLDSLAVFQLDARVRRGDSNGCRLSFRVPLVG